jgi:alkanesulfonate monooxygenase SsuD/methylene tetrahydromethanopterin reductase-like flavin-dependent oxidoreductase (luciferase family)
LKLAIFSEIPVAKPRAPGAEQKAIQDTIEQAVFAEKMGFHSFWSPEHHFLDQMSHSTNPEIIYAAIAARTTTLRLGYGVRLMPAPYNHPVRTAESVATLDCVSGGRVEFGIGRSATRRELEGFGINPHDTREMQEEALRHVVGIWTNEEYSFEGKHWSMPPRTVIPKPVQKPHPPLWCASSTPDGHYEIGKMGLGVLSFATATPPEELITKYKAYEDGLAACDNPVGKYINSQKVALSFTYCAETDEEAKVVGLGAMKKHMEYALPLYGALPDYARQFQQDLGTFAYTTEFKKKVEEGGGVPKFDIDEIFNIGGAMMGDPKRCLDLALRFEAIGADILFCSINPWDLTHEQVMRSIELLGTHVVPVLAERERAKAAADGQTGKAVA